MYYNVYIRILIIPRDTEYNLRNSNRKLISPKPRTDFCLKHSFSFITGQKYGTNYHHRYETLNLRGILKGKSTGYFYVTIEFPHSNHINQYKVYILVADEVASSSILVNLDNYYGEVASSSMILVKLDNYHGEVASSSILVKLDNYHGEVASHL